MFRSILTTASMGVLVTGCTESTPPPASPPPITVETRLDEPPETTAKPSTSTAVQETWSHTMPWNDGKDRTVILKYVKDQDGSERFEFVQQYWSYKPVFVDQVKNGEETEIRFKMVQSANESELTDRTLRYVLNEEGGKWVGKLFESWNDMPYDVVLTKGE